MRLVITGATGLLGSELCRSLQGRYSVIAWARRAPDITQLETVETTLKSLQPDLVIHTAAMTDVDACEGDPEGAMRVNALGAENVAKACASAGAALMAISTDYVFDGCLGRPYREGDPTNPVNAYGRSKLEGERRAFKFSPKCMVVRVSGLFGAGRANFVTSAAERFKAGEPVSVVTDQAYSPSYTVDLAAGIGQLIRKWEADPREALAGGECHGVFHLANDGAGSRLEVALRIARFLGVSEPVIRQTTWKGLNRPAQRPVNSRLECGRFARLCGAPLRPWDQALEAFLR